MTIYAFCVAVALAGQLADDDRYNDIFNGLSEESAAAAGDQSADNAPPPRRLDAPADSTDLPPNDERSAETAAASEKNESKPAAVLRAMLAKPAGTRIDGRELGLHGALTGAVSRPEQTERIVAYWELSSNIAEYYLALREQEELQRLKSSVAIVGPERQQIESQLGIRVGTSLRAAAASQYRMSALMGRSATDPLPLPIDLPHCGDYHTRFDQVFAGRPLIAAQQLSELVSLRYEELKESAAAITRAEEWRDVASSDGRTTLQAFELVSLRRSAFLHVVSDYNTQIARYVELATPGRIDSAQLVSMLIKRPKTDVASSQTTSATTRQSSDDDWAPVGSSAIRDEAVEQASAESTHAPGEERSLLVPKK